MADSLLLAEHIELLGRAPSAIPACAGAVFVLAPGFDLGAPQPTANLVASMLDGERPAGARSSNRTLSLPVVILGPSRAVVAAAREVLVRAVSQPHFTLTWTRDQGLPFVLDCYAANATVVDYDLRRDKASISNVGLSFTAQPFGRSDSPVIVEFPAPLAGQTAPPAPVVIDDFSTGLPSGNWTQSLIGPGPFSAFYNSGGSGSGQVASRTRSGLGAMNLTGLNGLTVQAGFGSTSWFKWWGLKKAGPVQFAFTLSDGTHSATVHVTRRVKMSSNSYQPVWQTIRVPIPSGGGLNLAAITGYTIKVSNRAAGDLLYTELYLDSFQAVPYATAQAAAPSAGIVYDLAGIAGSARSAFSLQLQQPAGSTQSVTKRFTAAGAFNWLCPAGVTQISKIIALGGGGRGAKSTGASNSGAGGGGGELASEINTATTPGTVYAGQVATGGASGSGTGGDSFFTVGALTVRGHGGANVADGGITGGAGGTGSTNTTHFNGGAGGAGTNTNTVGGGGGGSAGPTGAGGAGGSGASGGAPGAAGSGGQPSGAGGQGGVLGPGLSGHTPGGGGGGDIGNDKTVTRGGPGEVDLTYLQTTAFKTAVVHRPGTDAPDTFAPFCPLGGSAGVPDGTTEYLMPSLLTGVPARFGSPDKPFTVSVYAVASSWNNPSAARTITVTVNQYEQAGGTVYPVSVARSVTPNSLASPLVLIGELTLPDHAMPDDNTNAYFTVAITSGNTADRFQDALFLDVLGSTVIIESPVAYTSYWIDEPPPSVDLGNIMASQFDRPDAVSVLAYATVSGPPLHVSPFGNQSLLCYVADAGLAAPSAELTHFPRWMFERLA